VNRLQIHKKNYMNKLNFTIFSLIIMFCASIVFAVGLDELEYPIEELGGCESQAACESYCNLEENKGACLDFAETNELLAPEKIKYARTMMKLGVTKGPGDCSTKEECREYCADMNNIEECAGFARKYGLMKNDELDQAEKVGKALALGHKMPGDCNGLKDCKAYCELEENLDECVEFAEAIGMMNPEEAKLMRQTGGKGPGECKGKKECEEYCSDPDNAEECMDFALDKGLMSLSEEADAKKVLNALKKGVKMPNCQRSECDKYCQEEENAEECLVFAEVAGFMNAAETKEIRRRIQEGKTKEQEAKKAMLGKEGPGGCQGKVECDAYCNIDDNQEECADYLLEQGKISQEEHNRLRAGMEMKDTSGPGGCTTHEECEEYCSDPANIDECKAQAPAGSMGTDADTPPSPGKIRSQVMKDIEEDLGESIPAEPEQKIEEINDDMRSRMEDEGEAEAKASVDCAQFASVPDCSYVPEEAQAMCESCK
jgi:hypothetical protein